MTERLRTAPLRAEHIKAARVLLHIGAIDLAHAAFQRECFAAIEGPKGQIAQATGQHIGVLVAQGYAVRGRKRPDKYTHARAIYWLTPAGVALANNTEEKPRGRVRRLAA